jgi:hypothetical protein
MAIGSGSIWSPTTTRWTCTSISPYLQKGHMWCSLLALFFCVDL